MYSNDEVKEIRFTINGGIKTKQRPRATMVNGYARIYTPKETTDYEAYIRHCFLNSMPIFTNEPYFDKNFAISLYITCYFKANKELSKKHAKLGYFPECVKHKDIDNICKIVMDGLNGSLYEDDKQVNKLVAQKCYTEEEERIEVVCYANSVEIAEKTA